MPAIIAPIALSHAQSYRDCLDAVARERKYLAQLEALPIEPRVDNQRAIRLYEKLGFVHEARRKNAMRFDGEYHDAFQMRLLLDEQT